MPRIAHGDGRGFNKTSSLNRSTDEVTRTFERLTEVTRAPLKKEEGLASKKRLCKAAGAL